VPTSVSRNVKIHDKLPVRGGEPPEPDYLSEWASGEHQPKQHWKVELADRRSWSKLLERDWVQCGGTGDGADTGQWRSRNLWLSSTGGVRQEILTFDLV